MSNNLLIGLSSLLLPLGLYGVPAQSSTSYQRFYRSASINGFPEIPATNMAATHVVRDAVMVAADDVEIVSASPIKELVIVDAAVQDKAVFYRAVKPGVEIVEIDSSQPGLSQLKQILANYKNLTALHIISHATAGELSLGNSRVNATSLKQEVDTFSALKGALVDGADLFLYGCDVASGESGEELLEIIRSNTGLDVAASTNKTGNADSGGDWELEIQQGDIQNTLAFSPKALADFSGVLASEVYYANSFPQNGYELSLTSLDNDFLFSGSTDVYAGQFTNLLYLAINNSGGFPDGHLQIAASNTLVSFELQALRIAPVRGGTPNLSCGAQLVGYTNSSTVITQNFIIPDSETPFSVNLASFYGEQITRFKINASGCFSIWHSLRIERFTVDNKKRIGDDTTPPTFENATPSATSITQNGFVLNADINEAGRLYYVVVPNDPNNLSAPAGYQVKAGQNFLSQPALLSGNQVVNTGQFSHSFTLTGLNAGTDYDVYLVAEDDESAPNRRFAKLDVTTAAAPPTVTSVTASTANDAYNAGDLISIQVNFSANVTVTGTPQLTLETGSTDRTINYSSGSGSSNLSFTYTVQAGDTTSDLDYLSSNALTLNSGSIKNGSAVDAVLTLPSPGAANSLGANKALVIDTTAPTISTSTDKVTLKAGETATLAFSLSEATNSFTDADISVTGGSLSGFSGSGTSYTATFTPSANSTAQADINVPAGGFADAAGNTNTAAVQLSIAVNTVLPSVNSINRVSAAFSNSTSVDYAVSFSENVTGVDATDFTLTGTGLASGTISSVTPVSASAYTVTVSSISGDGTLRLDLKSAGTGIVNGAGNAIATGYTSGQTYTFDHTAPAVTLVSVPAASSYAASAQLNFTVNFNEAVTLDTSGGTPRIALTLDSGTVYASYVSGSGSSAVNFRYTLQSGDLDANGIALAAAVDVNGGTIKDSAGNDAVVTLNSVGSTTGILVDTVAPTAPSTPDLDAGSDTGVSNTDNLTDDITPSFTGTAEANTTVTVVSSVDGTLGTTTADGSGNWSYTSGTLSNGAHDITATATDAAGNVSSPSAALAIIIDTTVTSASVTTNLDSGDDSTTAGTLLADTADGSGLSLREALHYIVASGTVDFAAGLSGTTITLGSPLTIPAGITLNADALGSATITGNTLSLAGTLSITNGSGDNLTLGGSLAGTGALTKAGNGKLTLTSTDNSTNHSGGVTVTAGELVIASDSVFSSGTLTLNGGQLSSPNNANFNLDNPIVLGAAGGRVNLPGASANVTLSGVISGTGALSKINGGKLVLSGTNTFSGGLSVAGTNGVSVDSSVNLGSGAVTLNSSTILTLTGTAQTITNAIVLAGDATIANANAMTISGVISSTGGLSKSGAGVLTLSGTNTATGTINVVAGGLALSGGSAVADTVPVTVSAGATLSLPAGNETIGSLAGAGNVVLSYRLTTGADNTSTTFSGIISSTNTSGITKSGSGTFKLTGANTYSGSTQVSAGSLIVNGSNTASSGVTVASGATLGGTGALPAVVISSGGNLSPGDSGVGVLSIANGLTINSGGNLLLDIAGTSAGTQHDQLAITGTAAVGGASLVVTHSYAATNGDSYTVITNDLADSISGNFSGLAEGGVLVAGGNSSNLIASYVAGDGNDQSLTYTNLPGVPTAVTAVAGDGSASVTFSAPASTGVSAITGYTVTANPGGATLTVAGSPINFPGLTNGTAYTFTVRATNGSGTGLPSAASNPVTPSAPPVNAAPVITKGASTSVTMSEDGAPTAFALSLTATDSDNDTLTWSVSGAAQNGSASVSGGSVSYVPIPNFNGSDSFVVQVSDGEDTDSITVNVTVTPVNDAPVISGTPSTRLDQDTAYSFTPTATDIDTDALLTFSITNKPSWASFNTATGALTGTPANADAGISGGIVISVSDGTTTAALPAFEIEVVATIDPLKPIVTAPADLDLNAKGLFTSVSLNQLLGLSLSATQAEIDAVLKGLARDGVSGNSCCITTPVGLTNNGLQVAPGRHQIKWKATNAVGVSGEAIQIVNVKPLVSLSSSQIAVRGSQVSFSVILNGDSPTYPLDVPYTIDASSTATAAEHNLTSGVVSFTQKGQVEIAVPVSLTEVAGFSDSKLVVALGGGINAGVTNTHTIDIRTGNVPPVVSMSINQGGVSTSLVTPGGGPVSVRVTVRDANKQDTHTFDWSATSGLADTDGNPTDAGRTFNPAGLAGSHQVRVTVTDSAGASVQATAYFRVVSSLPTLDINTDTDLDGISDSLEGTGDIDDNGIPDYLDNMPSPNILPQQGNTTNAYLIECDPGVRCSLGLYARSGTSGGVQILNEELGSLNDLIVDPAFEPVGGIFDFAIRDLPTPGQSVRVAIPQHVAIPANAVYRKYQRGRWVSFVVDADNAVRSAPGSAGYCPPPGAPEWTAGLTAGHLCVQLTIKDGGPNDDDGLVNSAVVDPGAVSQAKEVVEPPPPPPKPPVQVNSKGGGAMPAFWLLLLGGLVILKRATPARLAAIALAVFSINTQAMENTYLRLDVFTVNSSHSEADFSGALEDAGHEFTLNNYDDSRTGFQIAAGYQWNELTYSEIGYLDLGDVEVNLTLAGDTDLDAFASDFASEYPITATGVTLVQGLSFRAGSAFTLSAEAGAFIWNGEVELDNAVFALEDDDGVDPLAGVKIDLALGDAFSLGLSGRRIFFGDQDIDLYAVSSTFRF